MYTLYCRIAVHSFFSVTFNDIYTLFLFLDVTHTLKRLVFTDFDIAKIKLSCFNTNLTRYWYVCH